MTKGRKHRGPAGEPLEPRRLLAGDVGVTAVTSVDVGLLAIQGDGDRSNFDDTIVVRPVAGDTSSVEVVVNGTVAATRSIVGLRRIEIFGGRGDDTLRIDAPDLRIGVTVNGGPGNDTISGGPRGDRLAGGLGDDTIDGGDGNDEIFGGAGDDYLRGGRGADRIVGGEGDDAIDGGLGNDTLIGGLDDDTIGGEAGNDTVRGDAGDDTLLGGTGRDKLFAGLGADRLFGITGRDEFFSDPFDTVTQSDLANPLVAAASEAEIREWLLRQATRWHHETVFGDLDFGVSRVFGLPQMTGGGPAGPASGDFSSTNNQVAGVDEADRVRTDGRYLYMLTAGEFLVIDADPASLAVVSRTAIEGYGHVLYLHGDRVTVLSQVTERPDIMPWLPDEQYVNVTVLDVTDRSAPTIVETTRIDGVLSASRSVGDTVYLIVENTPDIFPMPMPFWRGGPRVAAANSVVGSAQVVGSLQGGSESPEDLRERIATADLDSLLPVARSTVDGEEITQPLVVPGSLYLPVLGGGGELFSIVSLTPTDATPGIDRSVSTLGLAGTVYASLDSFIIASADPGVWWGASEGATTLHEFSLAGDMPHVAAGTVPGRVLDQFAIDAHAGGTVRVVTQTGWGRESSTNLFVLRASEGVLGIIGSVGDIAPGEDAMSARFVGDTAYVVTFEQVDPLFVIDLADPTRPNVVGELVIPGFSSYLHPLDGTHLVGIGRSADLRGVKLSLFDVSVPAQPTETDFVEIGGGSSVHARSAAEYDHHAFSYFAGHGVLAIPVSSWSWDEASGTASGSNALVVYEVDPATGFTEVGRIEHGSPVSRSLLIGGRLFSIAYDELKVVDIDDPSTVVGTLPLNEPAVTSPAGGSGSLIF